MDFYKIDDTYKLSPNRAALLTSAANHMVRNAFFKQGLTNDSPPLMNDLDAAKQHALDSHHKSNRYLQN